VVPGEAVGAFLIPPFLGVFSDVLRFGILCPCILIWDKNIKSASTNTVTRLLKIKYGSIRIFLKS